jgi:type IV secretory pathway protease TraF
LATRRFSPLRLVGLCLCCIYGFAVYSILQGPPLVVNTTPSAPVGLYYRLGGPDTVRLGALVAFRTPKELFTDEIPLPRSPYLLKRVTALPGSRICSRGAWVSIERSLRLRVPAYSSNGTPLPRPFKGCRTLLAGEWLPVGMHLRTSFDGRHFGPLPRDLIVGVYLPLLTF